MIRKSGTKWIGLVAVMGVALITAACGAVQIPALLLGQPANSAPQAAAQAAPTAQPTLAPQPTLSPGAEQALTAQDAVLEDVYRRVDPAVVNIIVSAKDRTGALVDYASGSGFVIDTAGHIVTNNHVIDGADAQRVTFSDGTVLNAEVVGKDPFSDLAVLKVTPPAGYTLTPVELGDSSTVQVGETVIAIGNPFGLTGSMTVGIVSAVGRTLPSDQQNSANTIGTFSIPLVIQTDAAINPGNSGGPLLDSSGRVIGVNAAIRSDSGSNSGISFAIPINTVKRIVPVLIEKGSYEYSYLGISSQPVSLADLSLEYSVPATQGVLVATVADGSPAAKAGLHGGNQQVNFRGHDVVLGGDIITAIDGAPVHSFDEMLSYLEMNTTVGQTIKLTVLRGGQTLEIPVTLAARPTQ